MEVKYVQGMDTKTAKQLKHHFTETIVSMNDECSIKFVFSDGSHEVLCRTRGGKSTFKSLDAASKALLKIGIIEFKVIQGDRESERIGNIITGS